MYARQNAGAGWTSRRPTAFYEGDTGMNAVVVYRSKTGFTKRYAEWISQELGCDIKENVRLSKADIMPYDTVIYGGGLYASGINGLGLIKGNFDAIKDKNLIVFATGLTLPEQGYVSKVWQANFNEEQRRSIKRFYFRGGLDYSKLGRCGKLVMNIMKFVLKNKKTPMEDEFGALEAFDKPVDFTYKENIVPLIAYVRGLYGEG